MEHVWKAAAVVCLVAAGVALLLWKQQATTQPDAAFVLATLGVVAWFLAQRNRLHKKRIGDDRYKALAASEENDDDEAS